MKQFVCKCGFEANTKQMSKHFKKFWTFDNNGQVLKNGHSTS